MTEPRFEQRMTLLAQGAPAPQKREADVVVSSEGVRVDGALVPVGKIAEAFFVPRLKDEPSVRLLDGVGEPLFEAYVTDEFEANRLLEALGRDVTRQRVCFEVDPPYGLAIRHRAVAAAVAAVAIYAVLRVEGRFASLVCAAAALNYLVMTIAPTMRVEVGADGVNLKWLLERRFLPYRDIASIQPVDRGVRFVLASGAVRHVKIRSSADTDVEAIVRRDALVARVRREMDARTRAASREELVGKLARDGRSLLCWARDLEAIGKEGGFRSASIRDEDLWDVLADASAPPDARAAAAIVVRRTRGLSAVPKLRVAADAIADPKLRVAIETVAADHEDAIAALGALDDC